MLRLLALLVLAACAQGEVNSALATVVQTPAERCAEAKAIVAGFDQPTTQERALVVATCMG